jgi:hypothetical protein
MRCGLKFQYRVGQHPAGLLHWSKRIHRTISHSHGVLTNGLEPILTEVTAHLSIFALQYLAWARGRLQQASQIPLDLILTI